MNILKQWRPERRTIFAIGLGVLAVFLLLVLFLNNDGVPFLERNRPSNLIISTGTIKEGDYLGKILASHAIPDPFINQIQNVLLKSCERKFIRAGDMYEIITSTSGQFQKLIYKTSATKYYSVIRSSTGVFSVLPSEKQTVWMEEIIRGKISENMYKDLLKTGLSENFVANLMSEVGDNIFAWKIDFFTEQRVGDEFAVLIEREWLVGDSRPTNNLRVLAAYYGGSGTRTRKNFGIRFQVPGAAKPDYYDLNGDALRKEFLRAPFTHRGFRVSSPFNNRRFHPILRTYRPHHGTDYAAPTGTPIVSIGNGTVVLAGWKGGYGNCVDVRHSNKYRSRYGHLSRISVREGQKVAQGQIIGYSGSTGMSSGPHLHFEMHVDGVQRNFLALNFSPAKSVENKYLPDFNIGKDEYMARLFPGQATVTENKTEQEKSSEE